MYEHYEKKLWTKAVNKSSDLKFEKSCDWKLWAKVLAKKSCKQKLWNKVVNKSCIQML